MENTVSVTTAPPTSCPSDSPAWVITGSTALGRICRNETRLCESPFAAATHTKSWRAVARYSERYTMLKALA